MAACDPEARPFNIFGIVKNKQELGVLAVLGYKKHSIPAGQSPGLLIVQRSSAHLALLNRETVFPGGQLESRENHVAFQNKNPRRKFARNQNAHQTAAKYSTMSLSEETLSALKEQFRSPAIEILTPDDEGYNENIKRFSDAAEKRAVRNLQINSSTNTDVPDREQSFCRTMPNKCRRV